MADLTKAELLAALDSANAEIARLTAPQGAPRASADWKVPSPAILTRSQSEALTPEQRAAFQRANGTVIEDAAN